MKCLNCRTPLPKEVETCPGCGVLLKTLLHNTLPTGTVLGDRYTVEYVIGKGSFGITYLAKHNLLEENVAIKEFFPQEFVLRHSQQTLKPRSGDEALFERNRQRFLREGKILYQLRNQKGIIGCLDLLEAHGTVYLVMEYLQGQTLKDEIENQTKGMSAERVHQVCTQVLDALEILHQRDIYHLDIKPENLWVKDNGDMVLLDFGASRKGMNRATTQAFTLEYAPPELLADNQSTGPYSDLFSLGMVCYELLTGKRAPRCTERLFDDALDLSVLPSKWQTVLKQVLIINPVLRLQNVRAWREFWETQTAPEPLNPTLKMQLKIPAKNLSNSLGMEFVLIQPGSFMMGSPEDEVGHEPDEILHQVTLTEAYYLQTTPVTQAQWQAVMGVNPSKFQGKDRPVEFVSWEDCQVFIHKLNARGDGWYVLPSEGQWEYACRAGTTSPFGIGNGHDLDSSQANFNGNFPYGAGNKGVYREETTPVKSFEPNAWGLYDMHGNVWEWVEDLYGDYPNHAVVNPGGAVSGTRRVGRGGSWYGSAQHVQRARSAGRVNGSPDTRNHNLGFRLVRRP